MAKAGMRRPDPKEPHGTESNHKAHIPKMMCLLYRRFRVRQSQGTRKQIPCNYNDMKKHLFTLAE